VDDTTATGIPGVTATIDGRAVRVSSEHDLTVLSSAVVGGGMRRLREIVNMHVDDAYAGSCPGEDLAAFAAGLGIDEPFAGLMTAAYTEYARVAVEEAEGTTVAAVVSVGLSNTASAGITAPFTQAATPGTINVILLVDAGLSPAAMVNAVITATEAKTMTLGEWDVKTATGDAASGTSTDTVVVACTGRGKVLDYAGPATVVGWLAARAVRTAMTRICREKLERDGGRRIGW
jgi:iron complex transport system ATP-binding protein